MRGNPRRSVVEREDVVAVMNRLQEQYNGVPERIQVDNGSEFISKALEAV